MFANFSGATFGLGADFSETSLALIHLGGFWLSLAHAPPAQIDSVMAARIAAMERIQAELPGTPATLH
jgi:hypothetical protein